MRFLPFVTVAFAALVSVADAGPSSARGRPALVATAAPGIVVDVSRLHFLGLGPIADLVQGAVARELAAGGLPAGGSRVVVRLTGLSMSSYVGSNSVGGGGGLGGSGGGRFDYLEGDYTILGPRGEVIAQDHQVVSSPASSGGAYYLPGSEERRLVAVSRNFADWLRRKS